MLTTGGIPHAAFRELQGRMFRPLLQSDPYPSFDLFSDRFVDFL